MLTPDLKLFGSAAKTKTLLGIALLKETYTRELARVLELAPTTVFRILDDLEDRQEVAVAVKAHGCGRFIARRRAGLSEESSLHVRSVGDQRVAFPNASRESGARTQSIFRRVRAAVHPNRHRRSILPPADGIGDRVPFERIRFAPDPQAKWSLDQIKGRPPLALAFHHFKL